LILQNKIRKLSNSERYTQSFYKNGLLVKPSNQFSLLQRIGVFHANRSSTLCYEIYDFFVEIYRRMIDNFRNDPEAIESAKQAVKNASYGVVMAFLGILRVFEGEDEDGLEALLDDGWKYMQNTFRPWKSAILEDLTCGEKTKYDFRLALNSKFHLNYLKDIDNISHIPPSLVYLLSQDWAKSLERSKIPRGHRYLHMERIVETYRIDSELTQGGLYDRMHIRNSAFWGPEEFSRKQWYQFGGLDKSSRDTLILSSTAAQFHTPVGREMCKVVHRFFEDLIQHLQFSYKEVNGYNSGQNLPVEAIEHIGMIQRAVSIAEYRVTVVVIGAVRILNQKDLDDFQLQILLMNAWKFLKQEFFKWTSLKFHRETSQDLFSHDSVRVKQKCEYDSPETMFRGLAAFKDKNDFPKQCITYLLRSWRDSISGINSDTKEYLGFHVASIPEGRVEKWNLAL
ncbi:hypothetical protein DFH28DRAFT_861568, partial [Melampsora americana]